MPLSYFSLYASAGGHTMQASKNVIIIGSQESIQQLNANVVLTFEEVEQLKLIAQSLKVNDENGTAASTYVTKEASLERRTVCEGHMQSQIYWWQTKDQEM